MMIHKGKFDSIVIGAGPAGSTAAYLLASHGQDVLILDKTDFPRNKLCAGLITWKTVNLIESVFKVPVDVLKSQGVISFESTRYGIGSNSKDLIHGELAYPFHFVERRSYDAFWLNMALEAGAEFRSDEKVVSLDYSAKKVLTKKGHAFHGNFIFAADGALSRIRRSLYKRGLIKPKWKSGLATALEISLPKRYISGLEDSATIYFGYIPWGYAWCFPRENRRILGVCGLNRKSGKFLKNGFKEFLGSFGVDEENNPAPSSHALPFGNYLRHPGYEDILLIGDACGLADPLLGEGIYYAHKSSVLAANAALQSHHNPLGTLEEYAKHLKKDILIELKYAKIVRQFIYSLPSGLRDRFLVSLFKAIPKRCEETIQGQRSFRWLRQTRD